MMKLLNKLISPAILLLLVITIGIVNFVPDALLTGWDNLHPEFNILLNIKRSFFAVWQEYQSFGLLGGMGHSTDLIRQVFLLFLSSFIPEQSLRYVWTIFTLFVGSLGAYYLTLNLLRSSTLGSNNLNNNHLPLLAGIFYLFNLATVQSYYVPFETFSAHFAFLPWMILSTLLFFNKPNFRNGAILFITLFLSTPQSYVPTLFVVYLLAASIILAISSFKLIIKRGIKYLFNISVKYLTILLSANAFWLLPFAYFTLKNSNTNINAKINQMATEQIILQNKEFGTIQDAALLKGFWFNAIEPSYKEGSQYLLSPWREHLSNPNIQILGYVIFGIILFGVISAFRRRQILQTALGTLFIFTFAMLANATPPFSWITETFRHLPLFEQSFRFPFTKFSILASLLYAYFFAVGSGELISKMNFLLKKYSTIFKNIITHAVLLSLSLGLIFFTLPILKGDLFYKYEQIKQPEEYQDLFSFFNKQDPSTRIAFLPVQTFWSWNYYTWGYGGSGFLWYGIKQPIIDRAFDVWSTNSEGSYYELSQSVYSNNPEGFEKVLNKYDITWLILDKNIYSPSSPKSLRFEEIEEMLGRIPTVSKAGEFGNIIVYKTTINNDINKFISSKPLLPSVNPYSFSSEDIHYQTKSEYKISENANFIYPFRTLFSNKRQRDKEFIVRKADSNYIFESSYGLDPGYQLTVPALTEENLIPIEIKSEITPDNNLSIYSRILFPKIKADNSIIYGAEEVILPLFVIPQYENKEFSISLNGNKIQAGSRAFISTQNSNVFVFENSSILASQRIEPSQLKSINELHEKKITISKPINHFSIEIPEAIDSVNGIQITPQMIGSTNICPNQSKGYSNSITTGEYRELVSKNGTYCTSINLAEISHNEAYLVSGNVKNIKGLGLHFWILNDNQGYTPIDTYFDKNDTNINIVVPPQDIYDKGYSLHFDNVSIGRDEVKNQIGTFSMGNIPYRFLTNIVAWQNLEITPNVLSFKAIHPNESLYKISNLNFLNDSAVTLTLSQSYDEGWNAYIVDKNSNLSTLLPFIFGEKIHSHIEVNNWANGWEIYPPDTKNKEIIILYLPQYLQYFGFLVLVLGISSFLLKLYSSQITSVMNKFNQYFEVQATKMKRKVKLSLS